MAKSADAFRTISEVSEWLDTPAHVLRFWESKFSQVKPVKRAGGRRYYRPSDMELLGGIKRLLHEDGMTIKGAQKLLREKGVAHVAALSQPLDDVTAAVRDAMDSKALKDQQEKPQSAEPPAPAPVAAPMAQPPSVADVTPFRAPPPAGPVAVAPRVVPTPPDASQPSSLLAAIHARKTALPAAPAAQVAALRGRLQLWLAKELG